MSFCSWGLSLIHIWPCCIPESSRRPSKQHASRAGSYHAHRSDAERHGSVLHTTDDAQQKQKTKRRQHAANPPSCPHILPAAVPCSPRSFAQHNDLLLHLPSSSLYRNGSGSLPLSSVHAPVSYTHLYSKNWRWMSSTDGSGKNRARQMWAVCCRRNISSSAATGNTTHSEPSGTAANTGTGAGRLHTKVREERP